MVRSPWDSPDPQLIDYIERWQTVVPGLYRRDPKLLEEHARQEKSFQTSGYSRRQVTELVQNAADAIAMRPEGEAGGRVTLEVSTNQGWLHLSVEDNGVGLPGDGERDRLTEPYVTHKTKGTGLGLAIVKKIMEDHGGGLTLADGSDGGARATLTLPQNGLAELEGLHEKGTEMLRHGA